jgi:hypothetical protein
MFYHANSIFDSAGAPIGHFLPWDTELYFTHP